MVRNFLSNLPKGSLALPAISLATVIFAYFREALIAFYFGASAELDAFYVALTLPKIIATQALLVFGAVIVPRYILQLEKGEREQASSLVGRWALVASSAGLVFVVALAFFSKPIISLLAPGLTEEAIVHAEYWFRILLPYAWFFTVTAGLKGILDTHKKFTPVASAGLIVNCLVVVSCLLFANSIGLDSIVVGLVVGSFVALCWQISVVTKLEPNMIRSGIHSRSLTDLPLRNAVLVAFGSLAGQARTVVDRAFLSELEAGSISALSYAETLTALPTTVISSTVGTILFPSFATQVANGDYMPALRQCFRWVSAIFLVGSVPVILLIIYRHELVSLVFERGEFTTADTIRTASALTVLPLMILVTGASVILNRLFIACEQSHLVAILGVLSLGMKISLNIYLVPIHGILGATTATVLAAVVATFIRIILLWRTCVRKNAQENERM